MTRGSTYGAYMIRSLGGGRTRWLLLDVITVVTLLVTSVIEISHGGGRAGGWADPPALAATWRPSGSHQ